MSGDELQAHKLPPSTWRDRRDEILKHYTPSNCTQSERITFLEMGAALGANPFTKEIQMVKYSSGPASIFLTRNFYQRIARQQSDYDGHYFEAVYSNDTFTVRNGVPDHEFTNGNRGDLQGAYSVVHRKDVKIPFYVYVLFREYNTGKALWASKPETMIKKVAESQALRSAFPGALGGTYDESEDWGDGVAMPTEKEVTPPPQQTSAPIDPEVVDSPAVEFTQERNESCLNWLGRQIDLAAKSKNITQALLKTEENWELKYGKGDYCDEQTFRTGLSRIESMMPADSGGNLGLNLGATAAAV